MQKYIKNVAKTANYIYKGPKYIMDVKFQTEICNSYESLSNIVEHSTCD